MRQRGLTVCRSWGACEVGRARKLTGCRSEGLLQASAVLPAAREPAACRRLQGAFQFSDSSHRFLVIFPRQLPVPRLSISTCRHRDACTAAQVAGMFWNYMSIGADAAAAHGFHQLRETKPWAARGRYTNQSWCVGSEETTVDSQFAVGTPTGSHL
jgi:Diacylglycerol kinase accessory domain